MNGHFPLDDSLMLYFFKIRLKYSKKRTIKTAFTAKKEAVGCPNKFSDYEIKPNRVGR